MKKSQLIATAAVLTLGGAVVMNVGAGTSVRMNANSIYGTVTGSTSTLSVNHSANATNPNGALGLNSSAQDVRNVVCKNVTSDTPTQCKLGCY